MSLKEVYFSKYCSLCKHNGVEETAEPCNECLSCGAREDSHRPVKFEGITKEGDRNGTCRKCRSMGMEKCCSRNEKSNEQLG